MSAVESWVGAEADVLAEAKPFCILEFMLPALVLPLAVRAIGLSQVEELSMKGVYGVASRIYASSLAPGRCWFGDWSISGDLDDVGPARCVESVEEDASGGKIGGSQDAYDMKAGWRGESERRRKGTGVFIGRGKSERRVSILCQY